jgi:hypothetical protein
MKTPICTKSDSKKIVSEKFLPVIRLCIASPENMVSIYKIFEKLLKGYLKEYEANITTTIEENLMMSLKAL